MSNEYFMTFLNLFSNFNALTLLTLAVLAFIAGFIDAVAGGGGLIQMPALLINFPNASLPTLFGTNKIAALSGTSISAYQYSRKIQFDFRLLLLASLFSAIASFMGAQVVSHINVGVLKPLILVILIIIAVYSVIKKDLGAFQTRSLSFGKQALYGSLIGFVVGFYDGFFGPGTGSFLVIGFVVILGFEFIKASAYSKVINCVTNISALVVFIRQGNYIIEIAILLAICNIMGSVMGTRLAIKKGNRFVRIIFILIVSLMIARYAYDVFRG
jgi:uncharacterized protein